jgi:hypothetical protein
MERIKEITKNYARFKDGRIDYSNERICFVLNCVVVAGNKVLLTKRSSEVIAYPNTLSGVSGFIDKTDISILDQAKLELVEEVGAPLQKITRLKTSQPFIQVDDSINREWHVFAVLVEFSEIFTPKTNWENKSADWYELDSLNSIKLMPGFPETLSTALKLRFGV